MPIRNIPVVTKLTAEVSEQPWAFGLMQRISIQDPTAPPHFPCHIIGSPDGLLCSHGTEMVAIPWAVLRSVWESANPKLIPTTPPKNADVKAAIKSATDEASKLP